MITGDAEGGMSSGALVELLGFQSLSHYALARIEGSVDPSVDSWNQTAKNESDSRLGADLYSVCYIAVGLSIVPDPLGHGVDVVTARTACQQIAGRITALVGPINNPEAA